MRISALTRVSVGMLFVAVIGMATTVFWGLFKLKEPFQLIESYNLVVEQVSVKTRLLIDDYLKTGNAAALQKAEDFLETELSASVSQLPAIFQKALLPEIKSLQQSLAVDLRAAGKLAGDIQGLMLQNERELLALLERLQDYVDQGGGESSSSAARRIQQAGYDILYLNAKRAVLRSSYFGSPSAALQSSLEAISQEMVVAAERLNQLPLLGVLAEAETDEFSAMMGLDGSASEEASAEDIGDQITDDILYLIKRYIPELARTSELVELGQAAQSQVGQLVTELENRVLKSKGYIDEIRADTEALVITLLIIFLILLFVSGVASALLQFRVLSGIGRVSDYIQRLRSGDFSETLTNNMEFAELFDLLDCANQLQSYLKQLVIEIHQEVEKVKLVSGAIDQLAEEIQQGASEQTARSDDAKEAIGGLLNSFKAVADHAVEASSSAKLGHDMMQQSAGTMGNLGNSIGDLAAEVEQGVTTIQQLQEDTRNIESVLQAIASIARQTNLLALNASIEAAKAGEQGRGFAVVADEVRMLAGSTSAAANEIGQMIDDLRSSSDRVEGTMKRQQLQAERSLIQSKEAAGDLQGVMRSITDITDMNAKITRATEKQSQSVDAVQRCVTDVQHRTRAAAERTAEARQQSEQLAEVCADLSKLVQRYTV